MKPVAPSRSRRSRVAISKVAEPTLARAALNDRDAAWLVANRRAIDSYNVRAAGRGVFSDAWRRF
jgi:post-segregation antitoxin (ccd killing protein)